MIPINCMSVQKLLAQLSKLFLLISYLLIISFIETHSSIAMGEKDVAPPTYL